MLTGFALMIFPSLMTIDCDRNNQPMVTLEMKNWTFYLIDIFIFLS